MTVYPEAIGVDPIRRFTAALASAADRGGLEVPVPACPGWTMGDLVWHLTEVQDFWTYIISARPSGPKHYWRPERPSDARLVGHLRNACAGLCDALDQALPTDTAWSWAAEQTVGFSLRRQAHEALTHSIDAAEAAGLPRPEVDPELAADGIDEIIGVMLKPQPTEETGSITLYTTDTDDSWTILIGQGSATVTGAALDINLWLWGRARTWPLSFTGDVDQAARLRDAVAEATQ